MYEHTPSVDEPLCSIAVTEEPARAKFRSNTGKGIFHFYLANMNHGNGPDLIHTNATDAGLQLNLYVAARYIEYFWGTTQRTQSTYLPWHVGVYGNFGPIS